MSNSSSCIDLIFTSQPNMVIESGIHSSLHSSCHHQIVFTKFNLKRCFRPPYSREVWHFKEAKTDFIRRTLNDFNWERAFSNVNEKVCIFNKSILNVLSNFIPHEIILCNDKYPPWFNSRIKSLLQAKNKVFNNYRKNKTNIQLLNNLNLLQECLGGLITKSKNNYCERMANKLNNLQRNSKAYWSLLKCNLNNKKILLMPLLFHENKFVTNFLEKAELFNSFFSKQCSLINNGSTLPTHMQYLTNNRLSSVTFSQDDIAKIIQNLDSGKPHGHNNISIRMLKICGSVVYELLAIIFKRCVDTGIFRCE